MTLFSRNKESFKELVDIDTQIFEDFLYFYDMECLYHRENREKSTTYNDNPCENIGSTNPLALEDEELQKRIAYFFDAKSPLYRTGIRVKNFIAQCIIKYGQKTINDYKERCLASLTEYGVRAQYITAFQKRYSAFWTYPLFIRAYFHFQYISLKKKSM